MFIDTGRIPATGNPLIDDAHRHLAEMVNVLFDQWRGGADGAVLRPGFDRFLRAVGRHFAEEEDIASAMGFPNVPEHAGKHKALMAALTSHVQALTDDSEAGDRRIDLFSLIDQMLYEHEILDDQEFWPLFNTGSHTHRGPPSDVLIPWSAALETGHAEIDRQHRTLVDLINGLDGLLRAEAPARQICALLTQIVDHARCHFQWEERQMAGTQAPCLETHRMLHTQLLDDLTDVVRQAGDDPPVSIVRLLKFWFIDHVHHVDGNLARTLKTKAAETAQPAQAPRKVAELSRQQEESAP